jgi:glycine/serine hydroxymethyltransferase
LKEKDSDTVADFIDQVLTSISDEGKIMKIGEAVKEFSCSFPEFEDTF